MENKNKPYHPPADAKPQYDFSLESQPMISLSMDQEAKTPGWMRD